MIDSENLCRKAMEIYGFPAQAAMVVEECSELTNAICKFRRGRVGNDDIITRCVPDYFGGANIFNDLFYGRQF